MALCLPHAMIFPFYCSAGYAFSIWGFIIFLQVGCAAYRSRGTDFEKAISHRNSYLNVLNHIRNAKDAHLAVAISLESTFGSLLVNQFGRLMGNGGFPYFELRQLQEAIELQDLLTNTSQ